MIERNTQPDPDNHLGLLFLACYVAATWFILVLLVMAISGDAVWDNLIDPAVTVVRTLFNIS